MSAEFKEKIRSLSFPRSRGTSRTTSVERDDGRVAGTTTEHWDGRVDACVHAPAITVTTKET